jgi:hypothetical protein
MKQANNESMKMKYSCSIPKVHEATMMREAMLSYMISFWKRNVVPNATCFSYQAHETPTVSLCGGKDQEVRYTKPPEQQHVMKLKSGEPILGRHHRTACVKP